MVKATDRDVARLIAQRQREALRYSAPAPLEGPAAEPQPPPAAYDPVPSPLSTEMPAGFEVAPGGGGAATQPTAPAPASSAPSSARSQPAATRFRQRVFTLTDALAYAQRHRREYQTAKEDLYLAALALTLERHLWTPQFAAELRQVYGNFGEITDFDQATRLVADLSVSQRLPYGGEFTAAAVSTLIRDVKRSITASEGSTLTLGLEIPFLRGAGHVAREDLIELERALTYAVRSFERFRRQQLVEVAQRYFALLAAKQRVLDVAQSLKRAQRDYERAQAFQEQGMGTPLDTGRAEAQYLARQNALASQREAFRAATDQFKIFIGMPIAEPLGLDDLDTIESIEQAVAAGDYPLLLRPPAAGDVERATEVAVRCRLDLLNRRDQIDDAKRGVAIAKNALLPDLDWTASLSFDTDPEHYKLGAFEFARATWRSELILAMNDRFQERTRYRASLIDLRRAQRAYNEQLERIRAQVLSAVNQIRLQDQVVEIQRRNVEVNFKQAEFARFQFEDGLIDNQALIDAENLYISALNDLNQAKTDRWSFLLEFRLATGTLRVDEDGRQYDEPALYETAPPAAELPAPTAASSPARLP